MSKKHENYDILNLIGYALAKFDKDFIKEFGFKNKQELFNFLVQHKVANTANVIKNRMDLFDYFFPNHRKGWWQKGDAYLHRKILIDSLFKELNAKDFANMIKLVLARNFGVKNDTKVSAIFESKFKNMQESGLQAELYFANRFFDIELLSGAKLEDARLYGDGYDFLAICENEEILCEVKGIYAKTGTFRLTQKEYEKAKKFRENYLLVVVLNLREIPHFRTFRNPCETLKFTQKTITPKTSYEYHFKGVVR